MNMTNTLLDNSRDDLKMVTILHELFSSPDYNEVKIATGYWDLKGMTLILSELKDFLSREGTKLQLLIGSDPVVRLGLLKEPTHCNKGGRFPQDFIRRDLYDLKVRDEYVATVQLIKDYCLEKEDESKLKIRLYTEDEAGDATFLHAKCYIFLGEGNGVGIIGSSNFTKSGLEDNAELNYLESNSMLVTSPPNPHSSSKSHDYWFNEKWNEAKPWNKTFLEEVLKGAPVEQEAEEERAAAQKAKEQEEKTAPLTPYEVYIKYLQTQFGDIADPATDIILKSYLPHDFKLLQYQLDAVKQCSYIMQQHNGFLLADVVGLGKTVIGVLLIKKFLAEAAQYERTPKVLIITPPAIKKAWQSTIEDFDRDRDDKIAASVTFVTTGSIDVLEDEQKNEDDDPNISYDDYGLILIDESHNFRNNTTKKYESVEHLIDNITLRTGSQPFVGLLSATPMNNRPNDIRNQIYLFQRTPNNSTIAGVSNGRLDLFFSEMTKIYEAHKRTSNTESSKKALKEMSDRIRTSVLDHVLVRRTRTDIKHQYLADSRDIQFPDISGPHKLEYFMDEELATLFADTVAQIAPEDAADHDAIQFYRYCAIKYFKDDNVTKLYEKHNLKVEAISRQLQKIMKILLVKRLESSKAAFKSSLEGLRNDTNNMLRMLEHDCVFICPDIDVNKAFEDASFKFDVAAAVIRQKIEKKGGNNREFRAADFTPDYRELLEEDLRKIDQLYSRWSKNDDDPKLDEFVASLDSKLFNEETNTSHKLIIFTEAIATQQAIVRKIRKHHRVLAVSAENREQLYDTIYANFDAKAKPEEKRNDYDILVTTEVLAEGVNLHQANVLLNYDTPWNATRLMQRIGRVNRIGSEAKTVYVYNFFPTSQSNDILHLIQNAYAKLQAFHIMFGEDNKVFSEMEQIPEHELRNLLDDVESEMGKFIKELRDYQQAHSLRYDVIKQAQLKQLGGTVVDDSDTPSLVLIHAPGRGFVPVAVEPTTDAHVVSSLEFMTALKCSPTAKYATPSAQQADILSAAMKCYNREASKSLLARNETKQMKEAMRIIQDLKARTDLLPQSIAALNQAMKAVRQKNKTVIHVLQRYAEDHADAQRSFLSADFDLNDWLNGAFAHIVKQNNAAYGQPEVALYHISESQA